jgi:hypothetical protein
MAGVSTGLKEKLTITPCKETRGGDVTVDSSKRPFEAMINPSGYTHEQSISYAKQKVLGQLASEQKFSDIQPDKIKFVFVIDGTGVVNLPIPGKGSPDVKTQIKQLETVVYGYDSAKHEPNRVRLLWGSFIFFGRLNSLSVEYTLFKPSGEPLRAKVNLEFSGFMSSSKEALKANRSSPDLTHVVTVKAGDTLPLLCEQIYEDGSYYLEVARRNGLINFRDLKPGDRLVFPPLR